MRWGKVMIYILYYEVGFALEELLGIGACGGQSSELSYYVRTVFGIGHTEP